MRRWGAGAVQAALPEVVVAQCDATEESEVCRYHAAISPQNFVSRPVVRRLSETMPRRPRPPGEPPDSRACCAPTMQVAGKHDVRGYPTLK